MLIGVKFCGGCNPRYDRKEYLERVKRQHPIWQFQFAEADCQYDILLVIAGCPSCCASYEQYHFKELVRIWEEMPL